MAVDFYTVRTPEISKINLHDRAPSTARRIEVGVVIFVAYSYVLTGSGFAGLTPYEEHYHVDT